VETAEGEQKQIVEGESLTENKNQYWRQVRESFPNIEDTSCPQCEQAERQN
jgi:hypothetical protein